jgi:hypothetical protein
MWQQQQQVGNDGGVLDLCCSRIWWIARLHNHVLWLLQFGWHAQDSFFLAWVVI